VAGLDYMGQYRVNSSAKQFVSSLGHRTVEVVDWHLYHALSNAGYDLDIWRDNKSVWSAEWIGEALKKFSDAQEVPEALQRRIDAIVGATEPGSKADQLSGVHPSPKVSDGRGSVAATGSGIYGSIDAAGAGAQQRRTRVSATETAVPLSRGAVSDSDVRIRVNRQADRHVPDRRGDVLANRGTQDRVLNGPQTRESVAYRHAKAATFSAAGGNGRRSEPLSMDEVVVKHIHHSHHSGAPYYTRNDRALERALRDAARISSGQRGMDPYTAGKRIQHGETRPKGRLVWIAPLSTTILGTRFAKPAYSGLVGRAPFAYARTNVSIGTHISGLQSRHNFVYCLDFSAFDASLPAWLIADCFDVLASHLRMDTSDKYLFDKLVNDFIHSRIVLPDLSIWQVHRGIPSGSAFTSLIGSIANYLIIQYVWIRLTGHGPRPTDVMVLGDDSIVGSSFYASMDDVAAVAAELGVKVNAEKSVMARSNDMVHFLGHEWANSRPHRKKSETAKRMAFPERPKRRTKRDSLARAYAFLQDSEEALSVWFDAFPPLVRDIQHSVIITTATVGALEVDFARDGPGLLTYKVEVEQNEVSKQLRRGTRLLDVGILY